jgi:hypothetical protein
MRNKVVQIILSKNRFKFVAVFTFIPLLIVMLLLPTLLFPVRGVPIKTTTTQETAPDIYPVKINIPKINVQAPFGNPLGIMKNGEVEVPKDYDEVGWYKYGPVPGSLGPAVVLGHVDSKTGPAVFYSIGQLAVGDEIIITLSDGREETFLIEHSELYEQGSFPTISVYGDIDYAGLRLVTCSGQYDKKVKRYSHNRVIFARLKN